MDYKPFETWSARAELFSVSDAQALALADNSVDTILSFETLEHLPDPARALANTFVCAARTSCSRFPTVT